LGHNVKVITLTRNHELTVVNPDDTLERTTTSP